MHDTNGHNHVEAGQTAACDGYNFVGQSVDPPHAAKIQKPKPVQGNTLLLWTAPLLLLVFGGGGFLYWYRRQRATAPKASDALSAEERARLDRLLDDGARQ